MLVDDDPAVRVGRDAGGGRIEPVAVRPPSGGDEQQIATDDRAVGQVEHDLVAVAADPHGSAPRCTSHRSRASAVNRSATVSSCRAALGLLRPTTETAQPKAEKTCANSAAM